MACAVLARARYSVAALNLFVVSLTGAASSMGSQAAQCSPSALVGVSASHLKEVQELLQRVKSGPFYKELVGRLGKPSACEIRLDGESITLSYAFHRNSHLRVRANSSIEFFEERAQLRGISDKKAVALLKESEQGSFGRDGCGINWNRPEEESMGQRTGSREVVYRGDVCSCQARVVYEDDSVVALILSSAC